MAQAKRGDTVKVHYVGKLENGRVFDESTDRPPLEFTIGEGQVIPGFEEAVVGMEPGESKTIEIPAQKAYGPRQESLVFNLDRRQLPGDFKPKAGQQLQLRDGDGRSLVATVTDVGDAGVTLDANHPLAGEDLIFEIKLVEID
ncbi:MAG: peptidylprolyl isomerase [Bacteroidetes bacterium]|nr:peptidylprolyl isomerase [Bacteroidota bacterium]